jgi:DNA polymerase-3 subunit epsilon
MYDDRAYVQFGNGSSLSFDLATDTAGDDTPYERMSLAARAHNASEEELARHASFVAGLKDPLWLS